MNDAQREAAVNFWTRCLQNPVHDNGVPLHNTLMRLATPERTAVQVKLFTTALDTMLRESQTHALGPIIRLSVDYDPDQTLGDALRLAGIPEYMALPVKTWLWVNNDGTVTARQGYGAPVRLVNQDGTLGEAVP